MNEIQLVLSDGEIKTVLLQSPAEGEQVIFDAIRFTVDESSFAPHGLCVTDDDFALYAGSMALWGIACGVVAVIGLSKG